MQDKRRVCAVVRGVTDALLCLTCLSTRSYTAITMRMWTCHLGVLALVMSVALVVGEGCGSKTIQYPEDHERYLRIDKAVESLRQAYVKKDPSSMAALMVPNESTDRLREEADSDFESFHEIAMEFRTERIMIDNDDIDVYVHWQGLWKKDPDDPGMRHRGHSRLQWIGTQPVLLAGMQGDIPFGAKGRQTFSQPPIQGKK